MHRELKHDQPSSFDAIYEHASVGMPLSSISNTHAAARSSGNHHHAPQRKFPQLDETELTGRLSAFSRDIQPTMQQADAGCELRHDGRTLAEEAQLDHGIADPSMLIAGLTASPKRPRPGHRTMRPASDLSTPLHGQGKGHATFMQRMGTSSTCMSERSIAATPATASSGYGLRARYGHSPALPRSVGDSGEQSGKVLSPPMPPVSSCCQSMATERQPLHVAQAAHPCILAIRSH